MSSENKNKREMEQFTNATIAGATMDTVQRFGSAAKEHLVAYSGKDFENNVFLKKGLKDIANSKVHPDYVETNLKQQAGFAAENKYTARQNAEHMIKGDGKRVHNTDVKGSGSYNELHDHIITENGNVVGWEQMKFVGNNEKDCLDKLISDKFAKYRKGDTQITLPSDYFEGDAIYKEIDNRVESLEKQINSGKLDAKTLQKKQEELKTYKDVKGRIKNSEISKQEALNARLHPEWDTAKEIGSLANRAGLEAAKTGALVGGSISVVTNVVSVFKGDKDVKEAAWDVTKTTAKSAAVGYATGAAGSAIKSFMQHSEKKLLQDLSKTGLPGTMVSLAVETSKVMYDYFTGKISGAECFKNLGQTGSNMVSSAMFATVGQMAIPIPVVGAMVGSMMGYVLSSTCYGFMFAALNEAQLAREERIRVEQECAAHIAEMKKYRAQMEEFFDNYLNHYRQTFAESIYQINEAYKLDDCEQFLQGCNKIVKSLGGKVQFETKKEFDDFMASDEALEL